MKIDRVTALRWLARGIVPGAVKHEDSRGPYWEIPEAALAMERPPRGTLAHKARRKAAAESRPKATA